MTEQTETPPQRVMRQWFQGKLGERLLQVAQMAKDRALLRRGARKQQDGTLGQAGGSPDDPAESDAGDDMQIRVGDEVHHHTYPAPVESTVQPMTESPRAGMSTWAKTALGLGITALASSLLPAIGVPLAAWMGAFDKPPVHAPQFTDTDTDTFPSVIVRPGGE